MQESVGRTSDAGSRRLVVMRHAKAEHSASTDHVRALAERGMGDAEAAGRWMRDHGVEPDAALVSDALRTQLADALRDVTKLRGEVELVAPGELPNDGKVIEDARKYD